MPTLNDYATQIAALVLPGIAIQLENVPTATAPVRNAERPWREAHPDPEDDELLRVGEARGLLGRVGVKQPDTLQKQRHRAVESRVLRNRRIDGGRFLTPDECRQLGCCGL